MTVFARTANLLYDSMLAVMYPQACELCGASVESRALGVACAACWDHTHIFNKQETLCWKCGLPSIGTVASHMRQDVRCRRCDDDGFSAARACGVYEGALRASVLILKQQPHLCRKLSELLCEAQRQEPLGNATRIIPVPLHSEREKIRGFNQARVIGRELSRVVCLPLDDVSLVRTRHTHRHRAGMDAKGRQETVDDAFRVSYPALISGERVLLVDDVFTTGATVSSCAKALLRAGAEEVFVLTIARPVRY
ncbi:MAG: phosphoribosyltransferase family protein [Pyrinomonadaceae bacterium]